MSRVRFSTTRALFEAFPEVSQKIGVAPTDQPPIDFLNALSSAGAFPAAVAFCAYLLPRREAVWWACGSVRALEGNIARDKAAGLLAAEAWVYHPDEDDRQTAWKIGTVGDPNSAPTWLALAAGWSGGFRVTGKTQVPTPHYMTARAARIAILVSAAKLGKIEREVRLRSCIAEGVKLAETGLS